MCGLFLFFCFSVLSDTEFSLPTNVQIQCQVSENYSNINDGVRFARKYTADVRSANIILTFGVRLVSAISYGLQ